MKTKLVEADFRVCCNHKGNSTACTETLNAIRQQFNNIIEIQATKPYGETEDMCVIGTATIAPSMRAKFEKDLRNLHVHSRRSIKIKKAVVTLPL